MPSALDSAPLCPSLAWRNTDISPCVDLCLSSAVMALSPVWSGVSYAVSVVAYDNFYLATPLHLLTMASLGASTPVDFQHCSKVKLGNCSGYFWHFRIEACLVFCRERLQATKSTRWYRFQNPRVVQYWLWLVAMTLKKMADKRILMNQ